jgi:hypothetical protein
MAERSSLGDCGICLSPHIRHGSELVLHAFGGRDKTSGVNPLIDWFLAIHFVLLAVVQGAINVSEVSRNATTPRPLFQ